MSNNHFFNLNLKLMMLLADLISHGILFHIFMPLVKNEFKPLSNLSKGALNCELIRVLYSCICEFNISLTLKFEYVSDL